MSERDPWGRVTPYELGIPGRRFAEANFTAIREEAEARAVNLTSPGAFFQLGEVGRVIREIQGEERGGDAIERLGAFLFHTYHFHAAGEPFLLVGEEAAREVVEGWSEGGGTDRWEGSLPAPAGYLQLPRHLFWSHPDADAPPEPIDGVFWTRASGDTLALLVALGVRRDRPGISVMELPPLPLADAATWAAGGVREEGRDFATTLPGGELGGLYSIVTLGEVLTLVGRVFGLLERLPDRLGEEERAPEPGREGEERDPGSGGGPDGKGGGLPSRLPFRRVLGGAGGGQVREEEGG